MPALQNVTFHIPGLSWLCYAGHPSWDSYHVKELLYLILS